ncbi:hypothetical protein TRFO_02341 [Tritrichomonas foetus]|uniref:Uncharacterized protein n=1 Tax=Tritrichomonas foetus TaxID=1144522 RepID=A0A1J4J8U2_9EUKA|nr:hypothetical protein TRFO_02341 [Tritrichomonas foetus]|eukprot:OHS93821.1 hypothetical protein TRFO_02341 [Tritrichomonas foetus]
MNVIYRKDGQIDGRCQAAKEMKNKMAGQTSSKQQQFFSGREKPISSIITEPNMYSRPQKNVIYTKDGRIDGRCQYARAIKDQISNTDTPQQRNMQIPSNRSNHREDPSRNTGPNIRSNSYNQKSHQKINHSNDSPNIRYRKDGELDGRCQFARMLKHQQWSSDLIIRSDGSIDRRSPIVQSGYLQLNSNGTINRLCQAVQDKSILVKNDGTIDKRCSAYRQAIVGDLSDYDIECIYDRISNDIDFQNYYDSEYDDDVVEIGYNNNQYIDA